MQDSYFIIVSLVFISDFEFFILSFNLILDSLDLILESLAPQLFLSRRHLDLRRIQHMVLPLLFDLGQVAFLLHSLVYGAHHLKVAREQHAFLLDVHGQQHFDFLHLRVVAGVLAQLVLPPDDVGTSAQGELVGVEQQFQDLTALVDDGVDEGSAPALVVVVHVDVQAEGFAALYEEASALGAVALHGVDELSLAHAVLEAELDARLRKEGACNWVKVLGEGFHEQSLPIVSALLVEGLRIHEVIGDLVDEVVLGCLEGNHEAVVASVSTEGGQGHVLANEGFD